MRTCKLEDKQCVPCSGGVPPLKGGELETFRKQLGIEWTGKHEGEVGVGLDSAGDSDDPAVRDGALVELLVAREDGAGWGRSPNPMT